ncbi:MAG: fructose-bisphosphatase class III, partial [Coprobacillus sp.]
DPCTAFIPVQFDKNKYDIVEQNLTAMMHKAITVIQLKLEGQLINKHPEYKNNYRNMLMMIDYQNYTISIEGQTYILNSKIFPTIDPLHPLRLTDKEEELLQSFLFSFQHSPRLKKHIDYLYSHGSMYKITNNNLLYHGCIPFNNDGTLSCIDFLNSLSGKPLFDLIDKKVKNAYYQQHEDDIDFMWYLWSNPNSPLFGKDKLAYFENYFIDNQDTKQEILNPYYTFINDEEKVKMILKEFQLTENGHIINGHVPIRECLGQNPIKANKRLFMIDGGISKTYQQKTGIAGYTLIYDFSSIILATHHINSDHISICRIEDHERLKIMDTDKGQEICSTISLLKELLRSYQEGYLLEKK